MRRDTFLISPVLVIPDSIVEGYCFSSENLDLNIHRSVNSTKRIVVVEDDTGYIQALEDVFRGAQALNLVKAYTRPELFLQELEKLSLDLIFLDINLPKLSGIECVSRIRKAGVSTPIVMLTIVHDDRSILKAFLNGADGYLLKDSPRAKILESAREALTGGSPMSSSIARKVVRLLKNTQSTLPGSRVFDGRLGTLSNRERDVLQLLAEGKKYQEIADQLFVSYETVKTHIHHIYEKLRVRNKAEAISKLLS